MIYSRPNVAMVIPNLKPKLGQSSVQQLPTRQPRVQDVRSIIVMPQLDDSPKIAITSIVRNEEQNGNLARFLDCCKDLEQYHKNLIYIFVEGDSSDNTYDILKSWVIKRPGSILEEINRGHSPFLKTRKTKRTIYFAELRNRLVELALSRPITEILMIDANYGWKGDIITVLRDTKADIVAPLVVSKRDNCGRHIFYDTWAFRKNGREFNRYYPYTEGMNNSSPIEIDSAGGCYLINKRILDIGITYSGDNDTEHFAFCNSARSKGFKVLLNPLIYVRKCGYEK